MNTTLNLSKFCSLDPTRVVLNQPFTWGPWTYATDGRILVRVPARGDEPAPLQGCPTADNVEGLLNNAQPMPEPVTLRLPEKLWEDLPCPICKGKGKASACPTCEGSGEVTCSECNHEHDCDDCHGSGLQVGGEKACEECNGGGLEFKPIPVKVGETAFAGHYLAKIVELPGVRFHLSVSSGKLAACFYFDAPGGEGRGILMPMNVLPGEAVEMPAA